MGADRRGRDIEVICRDLPRAPAVEPRVMITRHGPDETCEVLAMTGACPHLLVTAILLWVREIRWGR